MKGITKCFLRNVDF